MEQRLSGRQLLSRRFLYFRVRTQYAKGRRSTYKGVFASLLLPLLVWIPVSRPKANCSHGVFELSRSGVILRVQGPGLSESQLAGCER
jgi:hypothetical protein